MEEQTEKKLEVENVFGCVDCGADLKYKPGTTHLKCEYCGAENEIPVLDEAIEELDFQAYLSEEASSDEKIEINLVKCESCGAESTLEPNLTSSTCPYCATPLVVSSAHLENVIQPKSLLPFAIDKKEAIEAFKIWINKLWFAPNALKKAVLNFDQFRGVYIPFWTYDSKTRTSYIGQRGDYYYVTESYTTTENGKTVTKTRQVRKIRWRNASGNVSNLFDDILIAGTESLPKKQLIKLEPWDLENLVPYESKFLSGFITEKYQVGLEQGFDQAKDVMEVEIRHTVKRDIGGDEQRIIRMKTSYSNTTFKHILLPVFVSAYRFKGKLYRFLVNARTKEVQGERPWSVGKIVLAVASAIALGLIIYFLIQYFGTQPGGEV